MNSAYDPIYLDYNATTPLLGCHARLSMTSATQRKAAVH
jgi:hypothetical protein